MHPRSRRWGFAFQRRAAPWSVALAAGVAAGVLAPRAARAVEEGGVRYDTTVDVAVTAAGTIAYLGSEWLVKREFALDANWTRVDGLDSSVRDAVVWKNASAAHWLSYATAGAAPVFTLGLTALAASRVGREADFWIDVLLIAEATAVDGVINQVVKFNVRRQRPCAGSCPTHDPKDDNVSFYSEHVSLMFALAAAGGTVARLRGYPMFRAIWLGTAVLGAATAYFRMAAGEHYLTDVLAGAVAGTAVGVAVPYWFHRQRELNKTCATFAAVPTPHGGAMTLAWRW